MAFTIVILPSAQRALQDIPKKQRRQVSQKIDRLANDPFPQTSKKLQGIENTYRIDSGDYRILYQVAHNVLTVTVVKIGNRKDVYRNLQ